jgi:hypothetical protein
VASNLPLSRISETAHSGDRRGTLWRAIAAWCARLLGEPAFVASATEVVWEFAERRCLAIEE